MASAAGGPFWTGDTALANVAVNAYLGDPQLGDAQQHLSLVARVLNQGALAAAGGALTVRQGAADGPVLATLPFSPLAVGQAVDLPLTWEPGGLPGPTYTFYT